MKLHISKSPNLPAGRQSQHTSKPAALLRWFIATVWLINGFFCKVLNLVPRHELIVSRITGTEHARALTLAIGLAEMGMFAWIVSGWRIKENAVIQVFVIAIMNILEFWLVPDLLLWGKFNIVFAILFIVLICYYAFIATKKQAIKLPNAEIS
jgi:hypothetical protein